MAVLTVIHLDPHHPDVRDDLRDLCRMHGRVISTLGIQGRVDIKGRELWATPRPDRLLVQYRGPADVRWLPDGYTTGHTVHEVRTDWQPSDRVRWACIVNAVTCHTIREVLPDGTRRRVKSQRIPRPDPDAWARERMTCLDHDEVRVLDRRTARGRKPDGRMITFTRAHLTGTAAVTDPAGLAGLITGGLGKEKGYGCGLLLVGGAA